MGEDGAYHTLHSLLDETFMCSLLRLSNRGRFTILSFFERCREPFLGTLTKEKLSSDVKCVFRSTSLGAQQMHPSKSRESFQETGEPVRESAVQLPCHLGIVSESCI